MHAGIQFMTNMGVYETFLIWQKKEKLTIDAENGIRYYINIYFHTEHLLRLILFAILQAPVITIRRARVLFLILKIHPICTHAFITQTQFKKRDSFSIEYNIA